MPLRRGQAWGIDFFLAWCLSLPLLWAAWDKIALGVLPASFILMFASIAMRGNTPGKRLRGLMVTGSGCIICREIRRNGWLLTFGFSTAFHSFLPTWAFVILIAVSVISALCSIAWPVYQGLEDFPHNTATNFKTVVLRRF